MNQTIHLGISTCPNDTFAFHGLLERKVDCRGLEFRVELLDVEQLNRRLLAGEFDVAKASFHAAILLSSEWGVLPTGSALGFGVGPLLLAARAATRPDDRERKFCHGRESPLVLTPGEHTTACLLYKMFYPDCGTIQHVVFSEIMPALQAGSADFGVCIHEGRFTYRQQGLSLVEDLGTRWEQRTSTPLPLGGILARKSLGPGLLGTVQRVIRDSLDYGFAHRQETLTTMRRHAQELNDEVIWAHVNLYVNQWTKELGETGSRALDALVQQALAAGIQPADQGGLKILGQ